LNEFKTAQPKTNLKQSIPTNLNGKITNIF